MLKSESICLFHCPSNRPPGVHRWAIFPALTVFPDDIARYLAEFALSGCWIHKCRITGIERHGFLLSTSGDAVPVLPGIP